MMDCPGEDVEGPIEDAYIEAEEARLAERPCIHRVMSLIVDREKIESQTLRELGNRVHPHPPLKPWNGRIVSPKERERRVGEPTEMEKFKKDMAHKLKRASRRMSECGRIVAPRTRPRRCSQKPTTDNWLGRRRSRARANTLVRRASDGGAARGSELLQRGSVLLDHKRESVRRATVRHRHTVVGGMATADALAVKTLTGVNTDNIIDVSVAVQNVTDSFGKLNAELLHKLAWGKISSQEYASDPFYDWKVYNSKLPYMNFFKTEDYLTNPLSSYR